MLTMPSPESDEVYMDQLAQDIMVVIKKELDQGEVATGAMEIEGREKTRHHTNEDMSEEKYLTELDKQALLIIKNKNKQN